MPDRRTAPAPLPRDSVAASARSILSTTSAGSQSTGVMSERVARMKSSHHVLKQVIIQEKSWGCLPVTNPLRNLCLNIYYTGWFDRTVLFLIFCNCVFLALKDPLAPDSSTRNTIALQSEWFFTAAFSVEMLIRMTATGVWGENGYFADKWNWLDFLVVFFGYLALIPQVNSVTSLRTLRVLRPLRALNTVPGMKVLVQSMFSALPGLCSIVYFVAFTFLVFGIIGNQLWQGVLRGRCAYTDPFGQDAIVQTHDYCALSCSEFEADGASCTSTYGDSCQMLLVAGVVNGTRKVTEVQSFCTMSENPRNGYVSFDNFGASSLTIFVCITLEGWVSRLYALNGTFGLPWLNTAYFALLTMFAAYFLLNLALAVIWDEYSRADERQREKERQKLLQLAAADHAHSQALFARMSQLSSPRNSARSRSRSRRKIVTNSNENDHNSSNTKKFRFHAWCKKVVSDVRFEIAMSVIIFLNTFSLAAEHYQMPYWLDMTQNIINWVFTTVFAVEMGMKIYAFSFRGYLRSKFNMFDGAIVVVSIVEIILALSVGTAVPGISVLRAFRVLRAFKIAKAWTPLRVLFETVADSLAGVAYTSVVLAIFLFVYVLLGMQIFGGGWQDVQEEPRPHFDNLWWATVTVFQLLSTEDWDSILYTYIEQFGAFKTVTYTVSLILIGNYILLNLFLAILLSNFRHNHTDDTAEDTDMSDNQTETVGDSMKDSYMGFSQRFSVHDSPATFEGQEPQNPPPISKNLLFSRSQAIVVQPKRHEVPMLRSSSHSPSKLGISASQCTEQQSCSQSPFHGTANPMQVRSKRNGPPIRAVERIDSERGSVNSEDATAIDRRTLATGSIASGVDGDTYSSRPGRLMVSSGADNPSGSSRSILKTSTKKTDEVPALQLAKIPDLPESSPLTAEDGRATPTIRLRYKRQKDPEVETFIHAEDGSLVRVKVSATGNVAVKAEGQEDHPEAFDIEHTYGEGPWTKRHYSLYLFAPDNKFRRKVAAFISNKWFERFVLILIAYSCILLAVEEPSVRECQSLPESDPAACPKLNVFLRASEYVVTILFLSETLLKIIARGLIVEPHAYLRNPWDLIDFAIVCISISSLSASSGSDSLRSLRGLRALRALRPLRVIRRFLGVRLVINALIGSIPRVSSVVVVNILFMLLFAIIGVQSWMGKLYRCNDDITLTESACVGQFNLTGQYCRYLPTEEEIYNCETSDTGIPFERRWDPLPQNFDNVFNGLLCVFEVSTNELWPNIMHDTVDAVAPGKALERDYNPAAAVWFVLVQILFSFFMLEIFTGVIVDYYQSLRNQSRGAGLLTPEQTRWVESVKVLTTAKPKPAMQRPRGCFRNTRNMCYNIASNYYFDIFIVAVIMVNAIVLTLRHYGMSQPWVDLLAISNYGFVVIFTLEAVIKIAGFGLTQYISVGWNKFDFLLVITGLVGVFVQAGGIATFFRVFRVARLFRVIRSSSGLRHMFATLLLSLPALMNIIAVLLLVFFIYAVLGMNILSSIKKGWSGQYYNNKANFDGFWVSMVTLFRAMTGENWNGIMHDMMVQPPYCEEGVNCGNPIGAPIFFCSFVLVTTYVLVNMLVAVILHNFLETSVDPDSADKPFVLTPDAVQNFQHEWALFDPKAMNVINTDQLIALVANLKYPLGLQNHPSLAPGKSLLQQARRLLLDIDIPQKNNAFRFHAVLHALVHNARRPDWRYQLFPNASSPNSASGIGRSRRCSAAFDKNSENDPSAREAVALKMIEDIVRRWRFNTAVHKIERKLGRPPTDAEIDELGIARPGFSAARFIRVFVLTTARNIYMSQRTGINRPAAASEYVFAPPVDYFSDKRSATRQLMGCSTSGWWVCGDTQDVAPESQPTSPRPVTKTDECHNSDEGCSSRMSNDQASIQHDQAIMKSVTDDDAKDASIVEDMFDGTINDPEITQNFSPQRPRPACDSRGELPQTSPLSRTSVQDEEIDQKNVQRVSLPGTIIQDKCSIRSAGSAERQRSSSPLANTSGLVHTRDKARPRRLSLPPMLHTPVPNRVTLPPISTSQEEPKKTTRHTPPEKQSTKVRRSSSAEE